MSLRLTDISNTFGARDETCCNTSSEIKLQAKLQNARVRRGRYLAELSRGHGSLGQGKIWVIERIEHFEPKFETHLLFHRKDA